MAQQIELNSIPKQTKQSDANKTMQRLKKQMNRAERFGGICKAIGATTIFMGALGATVIGFEELALIGTAVAVTCTPLFITSYLADRRALKLEERLDEVKKKINPNTHNQNHMKDEKSNVQTSKEQNLTNNHHVCKEFSR